jgi:hypothetical protein
MKCAADDASAPSGGKIWYFRPLSVDFSDFWEAHWGAIPGRRWLTACPVQNLKRTVVLSVLMLLLLCAMDPHGVNAASTRRVGVGPTNSSLLCYGAHYRIPHFDNDERSQQTWLQHQSSERKMLPKNCQ